MLIIGKSKIKLLTYEIGENNKNPAFCETGLNDWCFYPYTHQDNLTRKKALKTYKSVNLENDYLKITVLTELGGRIYSVWDKKQRKEMFYKPEVIKPALIALRGAWICGGVEFNFGHRGHAIFTMSPVNFYTEKKKDRVSVIVGDIDYTNNTEWSVKISLYRKSQYFETEMKLHNTNPYPVPCYFWTNTALPCSEHIQFLYPTKKVVTNADIPKEYKIIDFPVFNMNLQKLDMSWIRSYSCPSDVFAYKLEDDWFVVYDHKGKTGVVHIADRKRCRGRKIFTWGQAREKELWTGLLSDNNTTYIEMQSGLFRTQLDQELIMPSQIINWKEYWYPFENAPKEIVKRAFKYYLKTNHNLKNKSDIELKKYDANESGVDSLANGIKQYKSGNDGCAEKYFRKCFLWDTHANLKPGFYLELAHRNIVKKEYYKAIEILRKYIEKCPGNEIDPMAYYYSGYCFEKIEGYSEKVEKCYNEAEKINQDYVFPHRTEDIEILNSVKMHKSNDYRLRYYLGNVLYYRGKFEEAISEWLESERMGNKYPVLFRNLGLAFWKVKNNLKQAKKYYEKAFGLDKGNVKTFLELFEIYKLKNELNNCKKLFEQIPAESKCNEEIIKKRIEYYIDNKEYDKAISLGEKTKFYFPREGEGKVIDLLHKAQTKLWE